MFVISNKQKIPRLGCGFKNPSKIYSLTNGFLFFVISISLGEAEPGLPQHCQTDRGSRRSRGGGGEPGYQGTVQIDKKIPYIFSILRDFFLRENKNLNLIAVLG
jgi:hypothetical protein